ncbi:MAG: HDOD domain-containing protein [Campylobacterales bacterium]|nr:HDOD domain-containing protein [Campylobacterales bacterium]
MITNSDLDRYIASIPSLPKVVRDCVKALNDGDLVAAANFAKEDKALMFYLKDIVNKPIYGFRTEIKDANQLFGILGLGRARQILQAYYTKLISPTKWEVFELNSQVFQEFQADLMVKWGNILSFCKNNDSEVLKTASIIPAALAAAEAIFREHLETLNVLKSQHAFSYDYILKKTTGYNFKDIIIQIAKKWELTSKSVEFIELLYEDEYKNDTVEYLKLLIQYELSRPNLMQSGANDLFEFDSFANEELIENFYKIIEKAESEANS